jgi:hypothetical protein
MYKIRADQLAYSFSNADIPLHGKSHTKVMHRATILFLTPRSPELLSTHSYILLNLKSLFPAQKHIISKNELHIK